MTSISGKLIVMACALLAAGMCYFATPVKVEAQSAGSGYSQRNENGQIPDIVEFLKGCPQNDPEYEQLKKFKIRRNGVLVNPDTIKCSEPTTDMPEGDYSDELLQLKASQVEDAMDSGQKKIFPWTDGTLSEWMRSKVKGVNIAEYGPGCCETYDNELYFVMPAMKAQAKWAGTDWKNISAQISSRAHEVRHAPNQFKHILCN